MPLYGPAIILKLLMDSTTLEP